MMKTVTTGMRMRGTWTVHEVLFYDDDTGRGWSKCLVLLLPINAETEEQVDCPECLKELAKGTAP